MTRDEERALWEEYKRRDDQLGWAHGFGFGMVFTTVLWALARAAEHGGLSFWEKIYVAACGGILGWDIARIVKCHLALRAWRKAARELDSEP